MSTARTATTAARSTGRAVLTGPLLFTLRTKGAGGMTGRIATVATRFGPTPAIMVRRLERMLDRAAEAGFRPTCPLTATVLARHPDCIRSLADRGMEFALHGLRHNDHLTMDGGMQVREILHALEVFARHGITPTGFRAPYLRADDATRDAVRSGGLLYQSDDAIDFPVPRSDALTAGAADTDGYRRALEMYDAQRSDVTACRPRLDDGLVRIPVCLPDDEMLVDRIHLSGQACARVWSDILAATHRSGDLFCMQVHPERFTRSAEAVDAVLTRAAALPGGVWAARLDEIARWWLARAAAVVDVGRPDSDGSGERTFTLAGDERVRIRLVGGSPSVPQQLRRPTRTLRVGGVVAAVGVAADTPPAVLRFLADDGFVVTHAPPGECAIHLGADADARDELALRTRILSAEHPVVSIDRWPDGRQSALALTGDIDALTVQDFVHRVRENAHGVSGTIVPVGAP